MFKLFFLFSAVLVAAFAAPTPDDDILFGVVGGTDATVGEFPYMVSLRNLNNHHFCGGSILNARTILTAAHCATKSKADELMVVVGSIYRSTGGTKYLISKITVHPDYNTPYAVANDIAILTTSEPITTSSSVGFIALPTSTTGAGVKVTLSGWGRTSEGGVQPNTLQKITLLTISNEECKQQLQDNVGIDDVCTFTKVGEGICRGDSGGPLADGNVLVGVVSRGKPCAVGYPDVYVRVSSYITWIKNNTHS